MLRVIRSTISEVRLNVVKAGNNNCSSSGLFAYIEKISMPRWRVAFESRRTHVFESFGRASLQRHPALTIAVNVSSARWHAAANPMEEEEI